MTNEGTLRYYGQASVMLDKETKAKLKAAAEAKRMDLWEYVRALADQATKDQQIKLSPEFILNAPGAEVVKAVSAVIDAKLSEKLDGLLAPGGAGYEAIKKLFERHEKQGELNPV